jgi:phosphoenolpyruvate synthase/pyruvate phosphate dikinase
LLVESTAPRLVVWLSDPLAADRQLVGQKGASLAALDRAGFTVPPAFIITTAAVAGIHAAARLSDLVAQLRSAIDVQDDVRRSVIQIRARLASVQFPEEVQSAVVQAVDMLRCRGVCRFAVRSSSPLEDRLGATYAGQFSTLLGPHDASTVLAALRSCLLSAWTDHVMLQSAAYGQRPGSTSIAVVVQQVIEATAAGVIQTADPVSGNTTCVSLTSTWGLGRAVAEGKVTPDLWRIAPGNQIVERRISCKSVAVRLDDCGETWEPLTPAQAASPSIDDQTALELANLANGIERAFAWPQEIEWAAAAGRLYVLQSRPLAVAVGPGPLQGSDVDCYASAIAECLVDELAPAPTPWDLATVWDTLLIERLAPTISGGWAIPRVDEVFDIVDGVAVRLDPRPPKEKGRRRRHTFTAPPGVPPDVLAFLTPRDIAAANPAAWPAIAARRAAVYDAVEATGALLSPHLLGPWLVRGACLTGQPTSPGRVVGRARLVERDADIVQLARGEILVIDFLAPSTTAILPCMAGLIVESGGSTSHTGTIARERHLPAILGTRGATRLVRDGDLVLLDAFAGRAWSRPTPARKASVPTPWSAAYRHAPGD